MFDSKKLFIAGLCLVFLLPAKATKINVKTIGQTYVSDTIYVTIGDTVHFIISIGHDAQEVPVSSYNSNVFAYLTGGFNFPDGAFDFVVDSAKTYHYACSFHLNSSQMKGVIISSDPLSTLKNWSLQSEFIFYPNPVENYIWLNYGKNADNFSFSLIDFQGKIIYSNTINRLNNQVDLSFLKSGTYLLAIQVEEKRFTKLLIKN